MLLFQVFTFICEGENISPFFNVTLLNVALVANEAFKFSTEVSDNLNNFFMNNGTVGNYSLTVGHEQLDDCVVCSTTTSQFRVNKEISVQDFVQALIDSEK